MARYIKVEDAVKVANYECGEFRGIFGRIKEQLEALQPTDVVEIKKDGEWEMFDLISSAYYGKGMYFKQDDGTVYSRYSCKHMSVDEAIREFVSLIDCY